MYFDPENRVIKLCAKGMELEGLGKPEEAKALFNEAWAIAATPFEKFTAAHYKARHQPDVAGKMEWDKTALNHALQIQDESVMETLPSLYLNIGKGYEDLHDSENANLSYEAALSFSIYLPDDGYGNMIRSGIKSALSRISGKSEALK